MAYKIKDIYPSQTTTGDAGWPDGKPRNIQGGVQGTGTPFEEKLFQDYEGSRQALFDEAGIEPSGQADRVGQSDFVGALKGFQKPADSVLMDGGESVQSYVDLHSYDAKDFDGDLLLLNDYLSGIGKTISSGNYITEAPNLDDIGNISVSKSATIGNSIYTGIVQQDAGVAWLHHNHLEESYRLTTNSPITSGNIPEAPLYEGGKQANINALAYWYQDFGLEATRAAGGAIGSTAWYYWDWLFHGSDGDGYSPERQPTLGYYRGDDVNVLDWQCYWLNEAGVTGVIPQPRRMTSNDDFANIRANWNSPTDVNYWMYQLFNNCKNFKQLTYALWAWSGSNTNDTATQNQIEAAFDELIGIYNEYDNFSYIEKNGGVYPIVFAFEGEFWRGAYDNYVGNTNTRAFLKAQANKFKAKGWSGFCVLSRNSTSAFIGDEDLESSGVIYLDAEYSSTNYTPSFNGGVDPAVDYEDLAIGVGVNDPENPKDTKFVVPNVMTSKDSHSKHPTTWNWPGSTPELFEVMTRNVIKRMSKEGNPKILTIYNVSEWAESGPALQPNMRDGKGYISALKNALSQAPLDTGESNKYKKQELTFLSAPQVQIDVARGVTSIPLDVSYAWTSTATELLSDPLKYDGKVLTISLSEQSGNKGPLTLADGVGGLGLVDDSISLSKGDSISLEYNQADDTWYQVSSSYYRAYKKQTLTFLSAPQVQVNVERGVTSIPLDVSYAWTSTATQLFNDPLKYDGKRIRLFLSEDSGHQGPITFSNGVGGLKLEASTISLGRNDSVEFEYNESTDSWIQVSSVITIL